MKKTTAYPQHIFCNICNGSRSLDVFNKQKVSMNTYYEASPYEQVPCLSQSEWMEIVSEGDISVDPLNNTICAMTKGYNVTNNQTVCHPEYFEAITKFCKIFSLPTYMIFILQTTQLWIQRDMLKATIIFVTSMIFFLSAEVLNLFK